MAELHISASVIVEQKGRLLLVEEGSGHNFGKFSFPGGRVKPSESVLACAQRETQEETGLIVEPEHVVGIYDRTATKSRKQLLRVIIGCRAVGG